ncbi:hypothetical protein TNIN_96551 [Trichonephila inaurata madagascariensis]|uniref:Uncharacterized protein n=1 Tax=Trichonephila inaurata madagascariensis TaxID=2747483 RepID=A0A8X6XXL8_9ARAC|nr:hypothetical protein TNIN_96551 [Trichonephila inaurata madagascariensis]
MILYQAEEKTCSKHVLLLRQERLQSKIARQVLQKDVEEVLTFWDIDKAGCFRTHPVLENQDVVCLIKMGLMKFYFKAKPFLYNCYHHEPFIPLGVYHCLALSPFHGKDTQPMMPPSGHGRP